MSALSSRGAKSEQAESYVHLYECVVIRWEMERPHNGQAVHTNIHGGEVQGVRKCTHHDACTCVTRSQDIAEREW